MGRFSIAATPAAAKQFKGLPAGVKNRFRAAFEALAEDHARRRPGLDVRPLRGAPGSYRLRVGTYRGIFMVTGKEILFTKFGHRSTVDRI